MDVSLFSRTIKELILENDRVGVPRLGHFVARDDACKFFRSQDYDQSSLQTNVFLQKDEVSVTERDLF